MMKIITINLPEKYLDALQILVDLRLYPSRSECLRIALHDFLSEEFKLMHNLEKESFKLINRRRKF